MQGAVVGVCSGDLRRRALRFFEAECDNHAYSGLGVSALEAQNFHAVVSFLQMESGEDVLMDKAQGRKIHLHNVTCAH